MSLKQMSLLCTSEEHLPHCTFFKKKRKNDAEVTISVTVSMTISPEKMRKK